MRRVHSETSLIFSLSFNAKMVVLFCSSDPIIAQRRNLRLDLMSHVDIASFAIAVEIKINTRRLDGVEGFDRVHFSDRTKED